MRAAGIRLTRRTWADVLTMWASPGIIEDQARPDLGPVAVLTLVPQITVHTADDYAGAETVDLIVSDLLRSGFGLLSRLDPAELTDLPTLDGWAGGGVVGAQIPVAVTPLDTR